VVLDFEISTHSYVLLGDSQTEFINIDDIFNYSVNGAPYYIHYNFVNEFENSISGKKVLIALNYHNLSRMYQNRLLIDSLLPGWKESNFRVLNKYNFFNHKSLINEINSSKINPINLTNIDLLIKDYSRRFIRKNNDLNISNNINLINDDLYRHWFDSRFIFDDYIQDFFLKELVILLKKNNCSVYFLKMPVAKIYADSVPSEIKNNIFKYSEVFNVPIIDLDKELEISEDYFLFKDYGHLNIHGDTLVNFFLESNLLED
jgi:hypothetical protein